MLKTIFIALFSLFSILNGGSDQSLIFNKQTVPYGNSGTLQKMIAANGSVAVDLDLDRLNGKRARQTRTGALRFDVENNSFFTILVFNDELRGPLPSSMGLIPQNSVALPAKLSGSYQNLVIENVAWGEQSDLVIRDGKSGFIFFTIEGSLMEFDPTNNQLSIREGRVLISKDFATALGRPSDAGAVVGQIAINATMRPIEITEFVEGEVKSETMPAMKEPLAGTVPGPDVIVGDLSGLAQFGSSSGTQVGLSVGTDSCNFGTVNLNWFANPANDHPVIPQNMYRMSGGADNAERFEQIGQSSVKHAFTALTNNICNLGCNGVGGSQLGSGCSDPYSASLNSGPNLGSRAWINPFTGFYPRGDGATPNNNHAGHTHTGPSHRMLTEIADLNTTLNPGATYFAEGQYVTPHEYAWCQSNPGQCNMYNNVSYRQYSVNGTTSPFSFTPVAATQRTKPAINAWTGATFVNLNPAPGVDGIGTLAYKVTNPSPGVWHYEYAIYNMNIDRAIQLFSVPIGGGTTISNVGFHAPPQHPGWANDGTVGNAGFSNTPWASVQNNGALTWNSETFAQNQNANAIRWGTLYNFRFDSNRPPQNVNATIGFFKTGEPITVQIQGPSPATVVNVSVTGRVTSLSGQGLSNVRVALTDDGGNLVALSTTNSFGVYSFANIVPGRTYTIEPLSKRYAFTARTMTINDNLTNVDFVDENNQ